MLPSRRSPLLLSPLLLSPLFLGLLLATQTVGLQQALAQAETTQDSQTQTRGGDSVRINGRIFGTTYNISARGDSLDKEALSKAIENRLNEIDARMSNWRNDSDVSRFSVADPNAWFAVEKETAQVVAAAKNMSIETDGAFDVTVAPLVRLWNFGAGAAGSFTPPTPEQIAEVLSQVGHQHLDIQLDPPALRKRVAGLELDLSAIAKGYAVDQVGALLLNRQVDHFMVEIGGEVLCHGTNRDGSSWRIGLEAPDRNERRVDSIISLSNEGLATSGDYRNFFDHNGITYSHTISPQTGKPVEHNLAAVTVISDQCMLADAMATAILSMGPQAGLDWAKDHNVKAMLIQRTNDQPVRSMTSDFPTPNIQPSTASNNPSSDFLRMFLITVAIFGIAIIAMAVGTIVSNRRLQGSCGGMAGLSDEQGRTICDMCTRPSSECSGNPEADRQRAANELA